MTTIVGILIFISRKKFHAQFWCAGRKLKLLVFNFLLADQILFSAELSMKQSFITSSPEQLLFKMM